MKNLKYSKGQMRIIETILASFIIVAALSFINVFALSPASAAYEMTDLEKMGYSVLHELDQQGVLTSLVYDGNWNDLRTILRITFPNEVFFNMTIYDVNGYLNGVKLAGNPDVPILRGDIATFYEAKNIATVTYCVVGASASITVYSPRILVLQITRG
jgi:hypothetical protein